MSDLAVLAPGVLLLLMLLLGRLERWLDDSTLSPPIPADRRRWHRPSRSVTSPSSVTVRAGRRAFSRRAVTRLRRRPAAAAVPAESVAGLRPGRRHLLGGRLRHGDR
jgi:hypothetical protein